MIINDEESSGSQHSSSKPKEKKKKKVSVTRKEFLSLQSKINKILTAVSHDSSQQDPELTTP